MTDSPRPQNPRREPNQHNMKHQQQQKRLCDYCNDTAALLYCRADSAKLCVSCDREVHSTNQLFSKHTRSLLCDSCDSSPASIFCETEHTVLCQNCDWERHSLSFSSIHNRRSIEGFTGRPSANELVAILGFEDLGNKKDLFLREENNGSVGSGLDGSDFGDGYADMLFWDSPVFSIDDLIVSRDAGQNLQAMGVPPLPKNRNAACGQHKEEIIRQLRELAALESYSNFENVDNEAINGFQSFPVEQNLLPHNMHTNSELDSQPISLPSNEENVLQSFNDTGEAANQVFLRSTSLRSNFEENSAVPDKSDIGCDASHAKDGHEAQPQLPVTTGTLSTFPKIASHELNSQERDSAISRYKEKKKTRRYDKHIRYESRKARAESRTRIKGRFAKIER